MLNEKHTLPALPIVCSPRMALMERIDALSAETRFVCIWAPGGSGKTFAARLWVAHSGRKPVWIGLDEYDNAQAVFYKLFSAGVAGTQPENQNLKDILFDPAFAASPVEHSIRLLTELLPDGETYAVVFDDMHLITNPEVLKTLPAVLKRLPQTFSTLVLSRSEPRQEFMRMVPELKTVTIMSEELMFTEQEMRQYLQSTGKNFSPDEMRFAYLVTGGLPIAVNAFAQTGELDIGKRQYVFENYLKEYIWDCLSDDMHEFYLKTSVVDELTTPLVCTLTGREDCGRVLRQLASDNTFLTRTGEDSFRYHHLFLSFLRGLAKEMMAEEQAELNARAARYYLAQGQFLMAQRYAVRSMNEDIIKEAVLGFWEYSNPSFDEYIAFSEVFNREELPEDLCEQFPYLYAQHMYSSWLGGDAKAAEYYLDKLYTHVGEIAEKFPQLLELVELLFSLDHRIPFSQALESFSLLPPITVLSERQQGASLTQQMPMLHRSNREYCELVDEELLVKLGETYGRLLRENWPIARLCIVSGLLLEQNRLREAKAVAMDAKKMIPDTKSPEFVFGAYMHAAAIAYALGEEVLLERTIAEAKEYIETSGAEFLKLNFRAFCTQLKLWNFSREAARDWIFDNPVPGDSDIPLYKIFQAFTTVRALLVLGDGESALKMARRIVDLAVSYGRPLAHAEALVLIAVTEWARGHRKEADIILLEALEIAERYGFIRVIANEGAAVFPALKRIAAKIDRGMFKEVKERAAAGDENALDVAGVSDDAGFAGLDGIEKLRAETPGKPGVTGDSFGGGEDEEGHHLPSKAYLSEVMLAARNMAKKHKGLCVDVARRAKPVKLSKQQRLMIEMLAKGYRSQEIAEICHLALPTVKGHLMVAYRKLDVNNAMDAILKARELGQIK